jgi:hypothetical protein
VGSTLYADRGPPFGLLELYGEQASAASVFVSVPQVKTLVAIGLEPHQPDGPSLPLVAFA